MTDTTTPNLFYSSLGGQSLKTHSIRGLKASECSEVSRASYKIAKLWFTKLESNNPDCCKASSKIFRNITQIMEVENSEFNIWIMAWVS